MKEPDGDVGPSDQADDGPGFAEFVGSTIRFTTTAPGGHAGVHEVQECAAEQPFDLPLEQSLLFGKRRVTTSNYDFMGRLTTAGKDRTLIALMPHTGIGTPAGLIGPFFAGSTSRGLLVSGSSFARGIKVWELDSGRLRAHFEFPGACMATVPIVSPNGQMAVLPHADAEANLSRSLSIFDQHYPVSTSLLKLPMSKPEVVFRNSPVFLNPAGNYMLKMNRGAGGVSVMDTRTGAMAFSFTPEGGSQSDALFRDSASSKDVLAVKVDGQIVACRMSTGEALSTMAGTGVDRFLLSADGHTLVTIAGDRVTSLRLPDMNVIGVLEREQEDVTGWSLSGDGNLVAFGTASGSAELWQTSSGKQLAEFRARVPGKTMVTLGPHAKTVLLIVRQKTDDVESGSTVAELWDIKAGTCVVRSERCPYIADGGSYWESWPAPVAFSADGRFFAVARVVDADAERMLRAQGPMYYALYLQMNMTQPSVVVDVWDLESRRCVASFSDTRGVVSSLAFSSDGCRLATVTWKDGNPKIWGIPTGHDLLTLRGGAPGGSRVDWVADRLVVLSFSTMDVSIWETERSWQQCDGMWTATPVSSTLTGS